MNNIIQPLFQYLVAWILLEVPLEHGNDSLNARTSFFDFDYSITSRSGPPPEYGFESFVQASKFRFGFIYVVLRDNEVLKWVLTPFKGGGMEDLPGLEDFEAGCGAIALSLLASSWPIANSFEFCAS